MLVETSLVLLVQQRFKIGSNDSIMKRGFSLVELIAVIMILGLLAAMAIPGFVKTVEETKNREAIAVLSMIRSAQRVYYIEYENYVTALNSDEINNSLQLAIESKDWDFQTSKILTSPPSFNVTAVRTLSGRKRTIVMNKDGTIACYEDECCCYSL